MAKKENPAYWQRWAVVLPAIGVAITGAALWYNNFFGTKSETIVTPQINQSASEGGVNIGGDNNGSINSGDLRIGDE